MKVLSLASLNKCGEIPNTVKNKFQLITWVSPKPPKYQKLISSTLCSANTVIIAFKQGPTMSTGNNKYKKLGWPVIGNAVLLCFLLSFFRR